MTIISMLLSRVHHELPETHEMKTNAAGFFVYFVGFVCFVVTKIRALSVNFFLTTRAP
jgi:hypothetical protein